MTDKPTALLLAHSDPPIHGQAVVAKALVDESSGWENIRLLHINAVYAGRRERLTGFSLGKVCRLIVYLARALRLARREKVGVIILTPAFFRGPFLKDACMIFVLRAFTRARLVGWVHMDPNRLRLDEASAWFRRTATAAIRRIDRWVACSTALLESWPAFIPADARTGLANGTGAPDAPDRSGRHGPPRIAYLSAMDPEKGWRGMLTAARSLCDRHPGLEVDFYGAPSGSTTPDQLRDAFSGPHSGRIRWHGPAWGEEKWRALARADLFCFPSHTEQFPIAVLDAMAAGLPVVATRVGAVSDQVVDGEGGWLVEPGDVGALEAAIEDAISDRARLVRFGAANRRRYEENFTREAFGRRWEEFLAGSLRNGHGHRD